MALDFGRQMKRKWFNFEEAYLPLNHGSYGTFPTPVRERQRQLQDAVEARPDPFIRYDIPKLLLQSRQIVAQYLNAAVDEVVFVPNATTAVNTVLRNLDFASSDVILYFSFAYPACVKTIQYICESTSARQICIDVVFPAEDDDVVEAFVKAVKDVESHGHKARLLMFDTVVTFPGVRLPWERLVESCRTYGVLSLIDGAHGLGHIDLTSLAEIGPDFFTSNCYKWLYTPRPCAIFYVPRRNQSLIRTSLPTSHGFQPSDDGHDSLHDQGTSVQEHSTFPDLFKWVATVDQTPYLCLSEAVAFRTDVCGGEGYIRQYCFNLARQGGNLIATRLGTEVLQNSSGSINQCCFTNIRLPLSFADLKDAKDESRVGVLLRPDDGPAIALWIMEQSMIDHNTWIPAKFYNGAVWIRISAQIYLELADFDIAADIVLDLCSKVEEGHWKSKSSTKT